MKYKQSKLRLDRRGSRLSDMMRINCGTYFKTNGAKITKHVPQKHVDDYF